MYYLTLFKSDFIKLTSVKGSNPVSDVSFLFYFFIYDFFFFGTSSLVSPDRESKIIIILIVCDIFSSLS